MTVRPRYFTVPGPHQVLTRRARSVAPGSWTPVPEQVALLDEDGDVVLDEDGDPIYAD